MNENLTSTSSRRKATKPLGWRKQIGEPANPKKMQDKKNSNKLSNTSSRKNGIIVLANLVYVCVYKRLWNIIYDKLLIIV